MSSRAMLLFLAGCSALASVMLTIWIVSKRGSASSGSSFQERGASAISITDGNVRSPLGVRGQSGDQKNKQRLQQIRNGTYDKTKALDWTVEEFEAFLDQKALKMDDADMAMLLIRMLPDQKSSLPKANKLIQGSITLQDQVSIARKYLDTSGCAMLISVLWHDWRTPNLIEIFRSKVLDTLPPDRFRQRMYCDYFTSRIDGDMDSLTFLMTSDELEKLRIRSSVDRASSIDYSAFVGAVRAEAITALEEGRWTLDKIFEAIANSKLGDDKKQELKNTVIAALKSRQR